jgi:hypothetical protein
VNERGTRRRFLQGAAVAAAALAAGCGDARPAVRVATDWPRALTDPIDAELGADPAGPAIAWLRVEPGARLDAWVAPESRGRADLVLSLGPPPRMGDGLEVWSLARPEVGLALRLDVFEDRAMEPPAGWKALTDPRLTDLIALGDPRIDVATLALARSRLGPGEGGLWAEGYADLVRAASVARPIGRTAGAPAAELAAGAAAVAPAVADAVPGVRGSRFEPLGPGPSATLVVRADGPNPGAAQQVVAWLEARGRAVRAGAEAASSGVTLLAELLGATLVDAQPELRAGFRALVDAGRPARLEAFLTEPPPWPPASVQILARGADQAPLVAALAESLVATTAEREALLAQWASPARPMDETVLGRLADLGEPSMRLWLRSEWTAWAQQRYRRVARQARRDAEVAGDGATPA